MPPAKAATVPTRKRNRKRKRRAASSSSSSSSSSSTSSEDESPQVTAIPVSRTAVTAKVIVQQGDSESESDSDSSASNSSSSVRSASPQVTATKSTSKPERRRDSHSPSPPPTDLPPFLPPAGTEKEEELKARFRKFWMASVADGFRADLEELHKEPNLTESRLSLLIDSLASGADVFMSAPSGSSRGLESISGVNEMEVVLDGAA